MAVLNLHRRRPRVFDLSGAVEKLSLPPDYEHLRGRVEPVLTPLPNPRELVQR